MDIVTEDQLVSELWARDVQFLRGRTPLPSISLLPNAKLVASLADSTDPRICFSLIPLFLRHPDYSSCVLEANKSLTTRSSQITLQFYYTAAVFLQKKYLERIQRIMGEQTQLKDLFSTELGITSDMEPNRALAQLAEQHYLSTGQFINWLGTYQHAADVWLRQMELQKAETHGP
jgi:hypothetical protein